ncbi:hypothetical protein HQ560_02080 [bacterium]|nr:hypothetical protein [bacterium]
MVQERYPLGKLYNEFEHGGYIAWTARRPVFIDSRGVLAYDPEHVARVVSLWTTEAPSLDGLDASVALVGRERVRRLFEADPRWRGVARTPVCWVYVTVPPPQD